MSRKAYVIKREKELVIRSSIIERQEYGDLKAMLQRYDLIDDSTIDKDQDFTKDTIHILKATFPSIVQNASLEWTFVRMKPEPSKCELDNRDILTMYYIQNQYNGKEIVVGSECIKKFDFRNGVSSAPTASFIRKQEQEQRKISRKNKLTQEYGNIDRVVTDHEHNRDEAPFVLPANLYDSYGKAIEDVKRFIKDYVDSNIPANDFDQLEPKLNHMTKYYKTAVKPWLEGMTGNKRAATLQDAKHLNAIDKPEILKQIRDNGGLLQTETAVCLNYGGFVERYLSEFKTRLSKVLSISFSNGTIYARFPISSIDKLLYSISVTDFVSLFITLLFQDEAPNIKYELKDIFTACHFVKTEDNTWELIAALNHVCRPSYEFLYDPDKYTLYIVNGATFTDRVTQTALGDILIPYIAQMQTVDRLTANYFSRINWMPLAGQDIPLRKLRELRDQLG